MPRLNFEIKVPEREKKDPYGPNPCCDDENVRASGTIRLPEQHFFTK